MNIDARTSYNINALKGIAVLSVLVNHYANTFMTGRYGGFANGIIGLFFLISGFLAYHSLSRSLASTDNNWSKTILIFYIKRAVRIYPLFILAMLIFTFYMHKSSTVLQYLGFDAPGVLWFVSSMIQCYLLSAILFFFIRSYSFFASFIVLLAMLFALGLLYNNNIADSFFGNMYNFRRVAGGHILLFAIGLYIYKYYDKLAKLAEVNIVLISIIFFGSIFITKLKWFSGEERTFITGILFCLSCSIFYYKWLHTNFSNTFMKNMCLVGKYSYSVYLFHIPLYNLLEQNSFLKKDYFASHAFIITVFPLFLILCVAVENATNKACNLALKPIVQNICSPQKRH